MFVLEAFHYVNFAACFLVGVPMNALLVWLIVHRSPDEMKDYRPILLLSTFTDIVYLSDALVVMPVIPVKDSLFAVFSIGPFAWLPQPWGFAMIMTWEFLLGFSCFSLAVPFVYRYFVICRGKKWGLREFLAMLLVPTALCFEHMSLLYCAGYVRSVEVQVVGNEHFGFPADSNKTYVLQLFSPEKGPASLVAYNLMLFSGVNYLLIVIFGRRLYRYLNLLTVPHLSEERVRSLNKQISTTLVLQAVIPLVAEFVPMLNLCVGVVNGTNFGNSSIYMTAFFTWIPLLNPLVTMWVVRAYRRAIWGMCSKLVVGVSIAIPGSRVAPSAPPQIAVINAIAGPMDD